MAYGRGSKVVSLATWKRPIRYQDLACFSLGTGDMIPGVTCPECGSQTFVGVTFFEAANGVRIFYYYPRCLATVGILNADLCKDHGYGPRSRHRTFRSSAGVSRFDGRIPDSGF